MQKAFGRRVVAKLNARAQHQLLEHGLFDQGTRGREIAVGEIAPRQPLPMITDACVDRHANWDGSMRNQLFGCSRQQSLDRLLAALEKNVDMVALAYAGPR